ncbi:MAG: YybH family protein [Planctomycetota bacterium]|jgi:ketosteroid isomerase-like protein
MGKSQIAAMLVAGMLVAAAGCEMGGLGDEAQLTAALGQWKAATEAQDIDKMMEPYSDDYEGDRGEGKEGVRQFLSGMKDEGALEDIEVDISEAEIEIEGDEATVGPIIYAGNWGEVEITRTLKKESDGVWRVVGTEQY